MREAACAREALAEAELAEARMAQEAQAEKAPLLAAMRSQFRREWSSHALRRERHPGDGSDSTALASSSAASP
eukprot:CAMPEP_0181383894 /NCGR_PEP_ID=MMETSP1106-20121128/21636_1 /TAXON_ID=81844 /ORGANISM="Mantoniella antarctica, Strain SL-175" /LENGTH=72 /DNA_ID=CAMNT_0023503651 /DNA_START=1 /DNA_END=216 /DNA_ORIENTATION=-